MRCSTWRGNDLTKLSRQAQLLGLSEIQTADTLPVQDIIHRQRQFFSSHSFKGGMNLFPAYLNLHVIWPSINRTARLGGVSRADDGRAWGSTPMGKMLQFFKRKNLSPGVQNPDCSIEKFGIRPSIVPSLLLVG